MAQGFTAESAENAEMKFEAKSKRQKTRVMNQTGKSFSIFDAPILSLLIQFSAFSAYSAVRK
jgi:hypothetical protein